MENRTRAAIRTGDCWDWVLIIIETNEEIRITTIPQLTPVTFSLSWWGSEYTRKAIFKILLPAMKKDNDMFLQQDNNHQPHNESRKDDWWNGELFVDNRSADTKIAIGLRMNNTLIYKKTASGSKHTCIALIEVLDNMIIDNQKRPQQ